MGKNSISQTITLLDGESLPCPDDNCLNNPRVYVAKSIVDYTLVEGAQADPASAELVLVTGMTLSVPEAGNWLATFDSNIIPGNTNAKDDVSYGIFLDGIEIPESRRRVNSLAIGAKGKPYPIHTSTSSFATAAPGTIEVRACLQIKPTNTCIIGPRVLTLFRLP